MFGGKPQAHIHLPAEITQQVLGIVGLRITHFTIDFFVHRLPRTSIIPGFILIKFQPILLPDFRVLAWSAG